MHAVETIHPAARADAWAVTSAHCQAHYQIVAEAEPDVLCRVLNYFALQFLTPRHVTRESGRRPAEHRYRDRWPELASGPGHR